MLTLPRVSLTQGDPKTQTIQLPDDCHNPMLANDALVLGPSAALTSTTSVKKSFQKVPQLCVSQQSTSQPRLVSRSGQLQEQGFSVEVAERIAAPCLINKNHLQVKVGPI